MAIVYCLCLQQFFLPIVLEQLVFSYIFGAHYIPIVHPISKDVILAIVTGTTQHVVFPETIQNKLQLTVQTFHLIKSFKNLQSIVA